MSEVARLIDGHIKYRFSNVKVGGFFYDEPYYWRKAPPFLVGFEAQNVMGVTVEQDKLFDFYADNEFVGPITFREDLHEPAPLSVVFAQCEEWISYLGSSAKEDALDFSSDVLEMADKFESSHRLREILEMAKEGDWNEARKAYFGLSSDLTPYVPSEMGYQLKVRGS